MLSPALALVLLIEQIINLKTMPKKYQNEYGHWITELEPGEEPLSERIVGARLPQKIYDYIQSKSNKAEWIRRVLVAAALAEMESNHQSD